MSWVNTPWRDETPIAAHSHAPAGLRLSQQSRRTRARRHHPTVGEAGHIADREESALGGGRGAGAEGRGAPAGRGGGGGRTGDRLRVRPAGRGSDAPARLALRLPLAADGRGRESPLRALPGPAGAEEGGCAAGGGPA